MSCKQISTKGFAKFCTTFLQDKSNSYIMFMNRGPAVRLLQNVNPSTDFLAVCSCVCHPPSLFSRFPLVGWDNNSTYHPELIWYWKNRIRCGSNLRVILLPFLPWDIWPSLETLSVFTTGREESYWYPVGRGWEPAEHVII